LKRKIFSILFATVLAVSLVLVPAVVSADPGPSIGFWQSSDPDSGNAEFSTAHSHSPSYSAHLEAYVDYAPNDYHEVYVANPTGVTTLNDLDSVSLWYYCPSGDNAVAPLIDVWLDLDGNYNTVFPPTGDEEWLLGMIDDVTTFDAWVEVPLSDIEWVRAMGGTVYGDGSAGLDAAKAEEDTTNSIYGGAEVYDTLGECPVLAVGVETGGPGTYISSRDYDQDFYIDDLEIDGTTYDLGPTSSVGMTAEVPDIVAISANPTSIDFGTVYPGGVVTGPDINVENIGTVTANVDATLSPQTDTVFNYLKLGGSYSSGYSGSWPDKITNLAPDGIDTLSTELDVPSTYDPEGEEIATLIFTATGT
jgi:hypothetical protein